MGTERFYADAATSEYKYVDTRPAVVNGVRDGEYTSRHGKKGRCATVSAASKNQVRKWASQNGMKPQAYKGDKGAWTAECRGPVRDDRPEQPEEEQGLAAEADKRRSKKIHGV